MVDDAWCEPLLEGADASAARALVQEIADAVLEARDRFRRQPGGIAGGAEGSATFLCEAGRALGDDALRAEAVGWLSEIDDGLRDRPTTPWLFEGAAGTALALEVAGMGSCAAALRRRLGSVARAHGAGAPLELAYGLAGLGMAALAATDESAGALVWLVVDAIAARASLPDAWKMHEPTGRGKAPYVGVAHGVAGVVAFLAAALDGGIGEAEAPLREGVAFLRSRRRPADGGSTFSLRVDDSGPSVRSAYCHGDPGIGLALLRAGRAVGDDDLAAEAIAILARDAARPAVDAKVHDACFCHGAAGLAHLHHHAWRATGAPSFRASAARWFRLALATPRRGHVFRDFLTYQPATDRAARHVEDTSLLSGVTGVGAALASAIAVGPPAWDIGFLGPTLDAVSPTPEGLSDAAIHP